MTVLDPDAPWSADGATLELLHSRLVEARDRIVMAAEAGAPMPVADVDLLEAAWQLLRRAEEAAEAGPRCDWLIRDGLHCNFDE